MQLPEMNTFEQVLPALRTHVRDKTWLGYGRQPVRCASGYCPIVALALTLLDTEDLAAAFNLGSGFPNEPNAEVMNGDYGILSDLLGIPRDVANYLVCLADMERTSDVDGPSIQADRVRLNEALGIATDFWSAPIDWENDV